MILSINGNYSAKLKRILNEWLTLYSFIKTVKNQEYISHFTHSRQLY